MRSRDRGAGPPRHNSDDVPLFPIGQKRDHVKLSCDSNLSESDAQDTLTTRELPVKAPSRLGIIRKRFKKIQKSVTWKVQDRFIRHVPADHVSALRELYSKIGVTVVGPPSIEYVENLENLKNLKNIVAEIDKEVPETETLHTVESIPNRAKSTTTVAESTTTTESTTVAESTNTVAGIQEESTMGGDGEAIDPLLGIVKSSTLPRKAKLSDDDIRKMRMEAVQKGKSQFKSPPVPPAREKPSASTTSSSSTPFRKNLVTKPRTGPRVLQETTPHHLHQTPAVKRRGRPPGSVNRNKNMASKVPAKGREEVVAASKITPTRDSNSQGRRSMENRGSASRSRSRERPSFSRDSTERVRFSREPTQAPRAPGSLPREAGSISRERSSSGRSQSREPPSRTTTTSTPREHGRKETEKKREKTEHRTVSSSFKTSRKVEKIIVDNEKPSTSSKGIQKKNEVLFESSSEDEESETDLTKTAEHLMELEREEHVTAMRMLEKKRRREKEKRRQREEEKEEEQRKRRKEERRERKRREAEKETESETEASRKRRSTDEGPDTEEVPEKKPTLGPIAPRLGPAVRPAEVITIHEDDVHDEHDVHNVSTDSVLCLGDYPGASNSGVKELLARAGTPILADYVVEKGEVGEEENLEPVSEDVPIDDREAEVVAEDVTSPDEQTSELIEEEVEDTEDTVRRYLVTTVTKPVTSLPVTTVTSAIRTSTECVNAFLQEGASSDDEPSAETDSVPVNVPLEVETVKSSQEMTPESSPEGMMSGRLPAKLEAETTVTVTPSRRDKETPSPHSGGEGSEYSGRSASIGINESFVAKHSQRSVNSCFYSPSTSSPSPRPKPITPHPVQESPENPELNSCKQSLSQELVVDVRQPEDIQMEQMELDGEEEEEEDDGDTEDDDDQDHPFNNDDLKRLLTNMAPVEPNEPSPTIFVIDGQEYQTPFASIAEALAALQDLAVPAERERPHGQLCKSCRVHNFFVPMHRGKEVCYFKFCACTKCIGVRMRNKNFQVKREENRVRVFTNLLMEERVRYFHGAPVNHDWLKRNEKKHAKANRLLVKYRNEYTALTQLLDVSNAKEKAEAAKSPESEEPMVNALVQSASGTQLAVDLHASSRVLYEMHMEQEDEMNDIQWLSDFTKITHGVVTKVPKLEAGLVDAHTERSSQETATVPQSIYNDTVPQPIYNDTVPQPIYNDTVPQSIYNDTVPQSIYNDTAPIHLMRTDLPLLMPEAYGQLSATSLNCQMSTSQSGSDNTTVPGNNTVSQQGTNTVTSRNSSIVSDADRPGPSGANFTRVPTPLKPVTIKDEKCGTITNDEEERSRISISLGSAKAKAVVSVQFLEAANGFSQEQLANNIRSYRRTLNNCLRAGEEEEASLSAIQEPLRAHLLSYSTRFPHDYHLVAPRPGDPDFGEEENQEMQQLHQQQEEAHQQNEILQQNSFQSFQQCLLDLEPLLASQTLQAEADTHEWTMESTTVQGMMLPPSSADEATGSSALRSLLESGDALGSSHAGHAHQQMPPPPCPPLQMLNQNFGVDPSLSMGVTHPLVTASLLPHHSNGAPVTPAQHHAVAKWNQMMQHQELTRQYYQQYRADQMARMGVQHLMPQEENALWRQFYRVYNPNAALQHDQRRRKQVQQQQESLQREREEQLRLQKASEEARKKEEHDERRRRAARERAAKLRQEKQQKQALEKRRKEDEENAQRELQYNLEQQQCMFQQINRTQEQIRLQHQKQQNVAGSLLTPPAPGTNGIQAARFSLQHALMLQQQQQRTAASQSSSSIGTFGSVQSMLQQGQTFSFPACSGASASAAVVQQQQGGGHQVLQGVTPGGGGAYLPGCAQGLGTGAHHQGRGLHQPMAPGVTPGVPVAPAGVPQLLPPHGVWFSPINGNGPVVQASGTYYDMSHGLIQRALPGQWNPLETAARAPTAPLMGMMPASGPGMLPAFFPVPPTTTASSSSSTSSAGAPVFYGTVEPPQRLGDLEER